MSDVYQVLQRCGSDQGVSVIIHPADHVELVGKRRVHYYPLSKRRTAYMPETQERRVGISPQAAILLAATDVKPTPLQQKTEEHFKKKRKEEDLDYFDNDEPPLAPSIANNVKVTAPVLTEEQVRTHILPQLGGIVAGQKKRWSAVETVTSTAVGFALSMVANAYIIPWMFDVSMPIVSNLELTSIYTVLSLGRGYVLRRIFNRIS